MTWEELVLLAALCLSAGSFYLFLSNRKMIKRIERFLPDEDDS